MMSSQEKQRLGEIAARMVEDEMVVGLGTGSTAAEFIKALGTRIREDSMTIYGVPTSLQAQLLAEQNGITIVSSDTIDLAVDGADQVTPKNHLSKGGGGALLREKLVDYRADTLIILAEMSKFVSILTTVFVEVHPLAIHPVSKELAVYGSPVLQTVKGRSIQEGDQVFITESGNVIIALKGKVRNPVEMEKTLNRIPGVIENGIFTRKCMVIGRPMEVPG